MEHGQSWFTYIFPGYQQINRYLQHLQGSRKGLVLHSETVVAQHVLAAILVFIIVVIVSIRARAQLAKAGDDAVIPPPEPTIRNFLEIGLEALYDQMKIIIGHDAARYFPVIATLGLFIFFCNALGLISGFAPPTDNWNTTFACSIFIFLYYNFHGLRAHGMAHLGHMANPMGEWWGWFLAPLMFPIEVISHLGRPFSLAVRLSANMMGDHAILFAFWGLVPLLIPLPFLFLGLLVTFVQTLVFVLLSTIYIGLAVAHGDDHGEDHYLLDTDEAEAMA